MLIIDVCSIENGAKTILNVLNFGRGIAHKEGCFSEGYIKESVVGKHSWLANDCILFLF